MWGGEMRGKAQYNVCMFQMLSMQNTFFDILGPAINNDKLEKNLFY